MVVVAVVVVVVMADDGTWKLYTTYITNSSAILIPRFKSTFSHIQPYLSDIAAVERGDPSKISSALWPDGRRRFVVTGPVNGKHSKSYGASKASEAHDGNSNLGKEGSSCDLAGVVSRCQAKAVSDRGRFGLRISQTREGAGARWADPRLQSSDVDRIWPAYGAVSALYGLIGTRRVGLSPKGCLGRCSCFSRQQTSA